MKRLPPGLTVRPARVDDGSAVATLMGVVDVSFGLEPWVTENDVREDLSDPDLDLGAGTWVVEDGSQVVGYGEVWNLHRGDAEALEIQGWVAPAHRGRGIGSLLIDRGEGAATRAARRLGPPRVARNFIIAADEEARSMLEARGYECVRHFFHMARHLGDVGEPPPVPEGLSLRSLDPDTDGRPLFDLVEDAFKDHWNWTPMTFDSFWRRVGEREDFDPELTPLLFEGDRLIGASLNGTKIGMGWVEDLAVRKDARGKGLGELLLRHTFARFKAKGWNKVGLGVDSGNVTGAVRLYERVGMHVTRQFDAYEKEIAR